MKSYILHNQVRLVGKAWEIRSHFKRLLKQSHSKQLTVVDYISSINPGSHGPEQLEQQNIPLEKKKDHLVIPFPSL